MTEVLQPETLGCGFWELAAWLKSAKVQERIVLSLHDRQYIPSIHGRALRGQDFLHHTLLRRLDFVLHLHGFHDQYALAGFDLGFLRHQYSHDPSRHRSYQLSGAARVPGSISS
jgi:hypothetical protein